MFPQIGKHPKMDGENNGNFLTLLGFGRSVADMQLYMNSNPTPCNGDATKRETMQTSSHAWSLSSHHGKSRVPACYPRLER